MTKYTPNLHLPYPEDNDPPRGWEQIQALAERVEYVMPFGMLPFAPAMYDHMTTTPAKLNSTPQEDSCWYVRVGNTVWAQAAVTAVHNSTGGSGVALPFPAKNRNGAAGTIATLGNDAPVNQSPIAFLDPSRRIVVASYLWFGYTDIKSGQQIRYNVMYECEDGL